MGVLFHWFKDYKIHDLSGWYYSIFELEYIDGGTTSHSAGNKAIVQTLFEDICEHHIPLIYEDAIESVDYNFKLINPKRMSDMCTLILSSPKCDKVDMRDRIEWFKKLSDEGYYIAYEPY